MRLPLPYGWKKPRKILVNSMSDLFHERQRRIHSLDKTLLVRLPGRGLAIHNRERINLDEVTRRKGGDP